MIKILRHEAIYLFSKITLHENYHCILTGKFSCTDHGQPEGLKTKDLCWFLCCQGWKKERSLLGLSCSGTSPDH